MQKHGMRLRGSDRFALILVAVIPLLGALGVARGDSTLVAGPGENQVSIGTFYSTSTTQPAILAIGGGTISSFSDRVTSLPPGGLTGLQAQGSGSLITAENPSISASELSQTGISAVRAVNGGLITLDGGTIKIAGASSVGLFGDTGTVSTKDNLSISTTGSGSYGVEALRTGLVQINPGTTITTSGNGGFGIFAFAGGTVTANGIAIATSGLLSPDGFNADGARALGGTINIENSSISTSGDHASGLHVLDANSKIFGTNLTILTSGRIAAGAEADNGGSIQLSGGSISTLNDDSFGLFATNGGQIIAGAINISTQGRNADGAAALGGTINIENSSIKTSGDHASGLHVLDANSKIFGTNLTILTSGRIAAGAEADNGGSIQFSGGSISTLNDGSFGLFATNGGQIIAGAINISTQGIIADGAAALAGPLGGATIALQNSTITANGLAANGLSVSGAGSSIILSNSNVLSSLGNGASVDNGASLALTGSSVTALVHGIVATRGTVGAPNSITIRGGNLITVLGDAFQVQNGATNITVSNGAIVTGNSALLRVLDPPAETVVNFTASHASLFGDIFADPASQTTVNLTVSTVLTGKVNRPPLGLGVDMTIDGSSRWVMTGSSNVKSLSVSPGANAVFSPPFNGVHNTLTLGSLSGTGGIFGMNIDLRRAVGDLIDITGTSDGSHLLTFFDRGRGTDLRANEALLLVKTSDGVAGFSGMTDRAVYKYFVVHGNGSSATPNPDDWYLVRADKIMRDQVTRPANVPAGSVNTPVGLSPVDALSNAANAAIGTYASGVPLFYADMDTLIQRLGELRLLAGEGRASLDSNGKAIIPPAVPEEAPPTIGTWVSGFGNGMHINDQASRAFDQNTGGFQLGTDKRFAALYGDLYIGGFLSYFNASRDFLDGGNGSTNALSLGAYATWFNPKGWYADVVLKYSQLWNYFNTPASDGSISTAQYTIPSLGGSLEIGKRFDVGKFFIEPEAQLAGVWESGKNYTASNGLNVGGSDQYSLRGRLGLRAGMHFSLSDGITLEPYLKVSAVHEFLTGDRITLDQTPFFPTVSGTLVDAAAGLTARLNQSVYLYGEYDYANGDRIRQPWAVNLGVRWQWGGKQEEAKVERPAITQATGKETEPKLVEQPSPAKTAEPWEVTVGGPGWLAGLTGHLGGHGVTVPVDIGVRQIIINSNVLDAAAAEVRKGRFGVLGGYIYINAQASSPTKGLVSKVDVGLQQYISQLAAGWRLIEGSRGWLDLLGGFRFFYIGNQSSLQANEQAIDQASTRLVNLFGEQLATPNSNLRNLIQQQLDLRALNGRSPPLPVPPLADREPDKIRNAISDLIQAQQPELAAAIRTGAQARINQLKSALAAQVAGRLSTALNGSFSLYENWFDPFIGLRGRYNLNKALYLTGEADVGGFGIGSEITWQVYGALGCQITRNIYSEVGYRYLYLDYDTTSFIMQAALHGAQITVGLSF